jgi:hypothetical protein
LHFLKKNPIKKTKLNFFGNFAYFGGLYPIPSPSKKSNLSVLMSPKKKPFGKGERKISLPPP